MGSTIFSILCAILAWLFVIPSPDCPNRRYRRLFWWIFIPLFLVAIVLANTWEINDEWYTKGVSILACAVIASQISIHIHPNNY